jgi:hypothetical protein
MPPAEQLLTQHESASGPRLLQVRGSLIVSSLQTLRELDLADRYLSHLPIEQHERVLFALAASWLPLELAMAHYGACEAMQLTDAELENIGQHVSTRIMGTFLGTLMRSSRKLGAGADPHVPLRQYHRLWDRLLMGGGCTVRASGPKDASIESRGVPMFRYRYFRIAYTGLIRGAGLMFAKAVYTRIRRATDETLTIELSWV